MTLRTRLVLVLVALLTLGLAGTAVGTFVIVRQVLVSRVNQQLTLVSDALAQRAPRQLPSSAELGLVAALAPGGDMPSLFELRDPAGRVIRTTTLDGSEPRLPERLVPGEEPLTRRYEGNQQDWRILATWLPDRSAILVVGSRTGAFDTAVRRLAIVELAVAVLALVAVGLLGRLAIRRELRPLDEIAGTARTIGAGEGTPRVPAGLPGTEIGYLAGALNEMLDRVASSQEQLRRFVAEASHELRTPVAIIRGYAELFRRGAAERPVDLTQAMHRIEQEASRMGALVDELLLLASLDEDPEPVSEPVDLRELAADALNDARVVEPGRPWTLDAAEPVVVRGDPAKLRRLLANLVANVRTHTPPGAGATIRVHRDDASAYLTVTDSGPGVPVTERARIFERFHRGPNARSTPGAGLGLSVVAAVAEAHDGSAALLPTSTGAAFRVTLPMDPVGRGTG